MTAPRQDVALLAQLHAALAAELDALPAGLSAGQVITHARAALARNPDLLRCEPGSVIRAVLDAAVLGLPVGAGGLAHLVPHRVQGRLVAQLIVGYRGYLAVLRRSGAVTSALAHVVREHDRIAVQLGDTPRIEHEPDLHGSGEIIGAYAVLTLASGDRIVEWMSRREVDEIRNAALSRTVRPQASPWSKHYAEMSRKTVILRAVKRAPVHDGLVTVVDVDERDPEQLAREHASTPTRRVVRSSRAAVAHAVATSAALVEARPPEPEPPEPPPPPDEPPARRGRTAAVIGPDGAVVAEADTPEAWLAAYRQLMGALDGDQRDAAAAANLAVLRRVAARLGAAAGDLEAAEAVVSAAAEEQEEEDDDADA